jgi:hypothetical protein
MNEGYGLSLIQCSNTTLNNGDGAHVLIQRTKKGEPILILNRWMVEQLIDTADRRWHSISEPYCSKIPNSDKATEHTTAE